MGFSVPKVRLRDLAKANPKSIKDPLVKHRMIGHHLPVGMDRSKKEADDLFGSNPVELAPLELEWHKTREKDVVNTTGGHLKEQPSVLPPLPALPPLPPKAEEPSFPSPKKSTLSLVVMEDDPGLAGSLASAWQTPEARSESAGESSLNGSLKRSAKEGKKKKKKNCSALPELKLKPELLLSPDVNSSAFQKPMEVGPNPIACGEDLDSEREQRKRIRALEQDQIARIESQQARIERLQQERYDAAVARVEARENFLASRKREEGNVNHQVERQEELNRSQRPSRLPKL